MRRRGTAPSEAKCQQATSTVATAVEALVARKTAARSTETI
jgi:hypothetical protein